MFHIVAKNIGKRRPHHTISYGDCETIDEHEELDGARYLSHEYQLAFGQECLVWISKTEDGPPMEEL